MNLISVLSIKKYTILVGWKPPKNSWVKLNTYGACKTNNVVGCWGIVWDNQGRFLKYTVVCNVTKAELWGVFEGLKITK